MPPLQVGHVGEARREQGGGCRGAPSAGLALKQYGPVQLDAGEPVLHELEMGDEQLGFGQLDDVPRVGASHINPQRRPAVRELLGDLLGVAAVESFGRGGVGGTAELLVVDQLGDVGSVGVFAHLQLAEGHVECIVEKEPATEGVAQAQEHLERLGGLYRADDAGKHAQHATFGA